MSTFLSIVYGIAFFGGIAVTVFLMIKTEFKGARKYRLAIIPISIALAIMFISGTFSSITSVTDSIALAGNDPTGLTTVLGIFAAMSLPAICLMLGVVNLIIYGGIIAILWIIYFIRYAAEKRKRRKEEQQKPKTIIYVDAEESSSETKTNT
ncbi:MAG: hypothetical protein II820_04980 [Ruminiclostridium sp.]|nr:hypothetical protein [Ruminiclostridium sp.]